MPLTRRTVGGAGDDDRGGPVEAGRWGKDFPTLVEFLSLGKWPEGDRRELGTLKLFRDQGAWKAMLLDVDAHLVCFVTAESPEAVWKACERVLSEGKGDWRQDRYSQGKGDKGRR
jgi:hypothetical protein